jgi:hypothetical protein
MQKSVTINRLPQLLDGMFVDVELSKGVKLKLY